MGGPNLEVAKVPIADAHHCSSWLTPAQFGMYILFPITIMYYFGTNLDGKFTVPDFWPKPGQTHKIPYEREEIAKELERLKARNLENKRRREEREEAERRMLVGSGKGE
jgi:protein PET100